MNLNELKQQKRLNESELMEFVGEKGVYAVRDFKLAIVVHDTRRSRGRNECRISLPGVTPETWVTLGKVEFNE